MSLLGVAQGVSSQSDGAVGAFEVRATASFAAVFDMLVLGLLQHMLILAQRIFDGYVKHTTQRYDYSKSYQHHSLSVTIPSHSIINPRPKN